MKSNTNANTNVFGLCRTRYARALKCGLSARCGWRCCYLSSGLQLDHYILLLTTTFYCGQVSCGGGTYVRTLIVDLARAVGSAAHMTSLERVAVGPFGICGSGAAALEPVGERDFDDAPKLYAAMDEAARVLEASRADSAREL